MFKDLSLYAMQFFSSITFDISFHLNFDLYPEHLLASGIEFYSNLRHSYSCFIPGSPTHCVPLWLLLVLYIEYYIYYILYIQYLIYDNIRFRNHVLKVPLWFSLLGTPHEVPWKLLILLFSSMAYLKVEKGLREQTHLPLCIFLFPSLPRPCTMSLRGSRNSCMTLEKGVTRANSDSFGEANI